MKTTLRTQSWAVVFVFISIIFAISSSAQRSDNGILPPLMEDTAINPHDFTDSYYFQNGISVKGMIGRRTGTDSLSVFSKSSNPNHTDIRVIVTVPAYNQNGEMLLWYPLGELRDNGFTSDRVGVVAMQTAKLFPIYIFPDARIKFAGFTSFANNRQAPLIDDSWTLSSDPNDPLNPMGIREMYVVIYTEKAFGPKGEELMAYYGKVNGLATDDTPIIKSVEDIRVLTENGLIQVDSPSAYDTQKYGGQYAISPLITQPQKGVIAPDAFLWMATKDGKTLAAEQIFQSQFECLQITGDWCQ